MAPEQFRAEPATPAADVFAWGATMAYAATGQVPFRAERIEALYYQVLHAEPDLDGVPRESVGPVQAALTKDPAARPGVGALLAELLPQAGAGGRPTVEATASLSRDWDLTVPASAWSPAGSAPGIVARPTRATPRRGRRRSRGGWAAAAATGLVLVTGASYQAVRTPDVTPPETPASSETASPSSFPTASVSSTTTTTATKSSTPAPAAPVPQSRRVTCRYESVAERSGVQPAMPPTEGIEAMKVYEVTMATNWGVVRFEVDSALAPCTANTFCRWLGRAATTALPVTA